MFGVRITKNGNYECVIVDDYFPCLDKQPCFTRANGNELWVLILEKAWAKVHKSYERIIGGQSHQTFRDITGAPGYEYKTCEDNIWDII